MNNRDCIIRTRKCSACGMSHTTVEVSYNFTARAKAIGTKLMKRTGAGDAQPAVS